MSIHDAFFISLGFVSFGDEEHCRIEEPPLVDSRQIILVLDFG